MKYPFYLSDNLKTTCNKYDFNHSTMRKQNANQNNKYQNLNKINIKLSGKSLKSQVLSLYQL